MVKVIIFCLIWAVFGFIGGFSLGKKVIIYIPQEEEETSKDTEKPS